MRLLRNNMSGKYLIKIVSSNQHYKVPEIKNREFKIKTQVEIKIAQI